MAITVTITGSAAEVRAELAALLGETTQAKASVEINVSPEPEEEKPAKRTRKSKETPAAEEAVEETPQTEEETPEPEEKVITFDALRQVTLSKSKAGHKDAVKAILEEFSVQRIGELTEDQYGEVYAKIDAVA